MSFKKERVHRQKRKNYWKMATSKKKARKIAWKKEQIEKEKEEDKRCVMIREQTICLERKVWRAEVGWNSVTRRPRVSVCLAGSSNF